MTDYVPRHLWEREIGDLSTLVGNGIPLALREIAKSALDESRKNGGPVTPYQIHLLREIELVDSQLVDAAKEKYRRAS
jgi:hypothetical protein